MNRIIRNVLLLALNAVAGYLIFAYVVGPLIYLNIPMNVSTGVGGYVWIVLFPFIIAGFALALSGFQASMVWAWKERSPKALLIASFCLLAPFLLLFFPPNNNWWYPFVASGAMLLWSLPIIMAWISV